jgi:membrane-bound lytic murein transglycosylase B
MRQVIWLSFAVLIFAPFAAFSDAAFTQRKDVRAFIKKMATEHQFSEHELVATFNQVKLLPQIIESMDKPYEKKNWDVYKAIFITPQRLQGGLEFWAQNKEALDRAYKQYGVPPEIIVAILGVETLYGERQGEYRVLDTLSTLAFNYPKRAPYFTRELEEFLLLCKEHRVPATQYRGSYAGAIGKPQFMPSSYRYYAVDFNNRGKRDLITDNSDSIGSIANYFHKHGWKTNEGIAQSAKLKGYRYQQLQINPKTANYRYAQLESAGVSPITAAHNHPSRAALMEFVTKDGREYWMAYPNFFVITRYNSSPQYALVVYLLAQHLKMQWVERYSKKHRAYV